MIFLGSVSVLLGIIGIFLPVLPTTPFLLLGASIYIRYSEKHYNWLINHKWLGYYIKNYRAGNGITLKTKIVSISFLWISISYSALFVVPELSIKILLFYIAIRVTRHIFLIKTLKIKVQESNQK